MPSCGARTHTRLGRGVLFDRSAISQSLHLPQAALLLNARTFGARVQVIKIDTQNKGCLSWRSRRDLNSRAGV